MLGFMTILLAILLFILLASCWSVRYIWQGTSLHRIRAGLILFDVISAAGVFFSMSLLRGMPGAGIALQVISIVFMLQVVLNVLVLLAAGMRWLYRCMMRVPVDPKRRRLLRGAMLYPAAAASVGLYGGLYEREHTVEREYVIPIAGGSSLQGFRAAQLSDVHLGLFYSLDRLRGLLQKAAAGKPDALLLTGDIFDDDSQNEQAVRLVDSFSAAFPKGIWYCYGNHEHMRNLKKIKAALATSKIHVLVNEAVKVLDGEMPLYFAGADYPMDRPHFAEQKRIYAQRTFADVPQGAAVILLAHHPEFIDDGAEYGAQLTLTGHTHGAQIGLFGRPLLPVFKYTRGMFRQGECYGYVHSGNGSWFPYRLGCPPEIAYFTLKGV